MSEDRRAVVQLAVLRCNNPHCRIVTFHGVVAQPPLNACPSCQSLGVEAT